MSSFELREEVQALQDETYEIGQEHDVETMDEGGIHDLLDGVVETVAESSENITNTATFDTYRSLLKHHSHLKGSVMSKMLDSISSGLSTQVDAAMHDIESVDQQTAMSHRLPLEMYCFLLQWFASIADKEKPADGDDPISVPPSTRGRRGRGGKGGTGKAAGGRGQSKKAAERWSWVDQIPGILALVSRTLRLKTKRVWTSTSDLDAFITCVTRPVYHVMESEQHMKSEPIRMGVYKALCLAVKHHGHVLVAQTRIIQDLQYCEHLAEPMAELLNLLAKEFDHVQLTDEILREIAKMSFKAQENKESRVISKFLVRLAETIPRTVLRQMAVLQVHLDSESYPMRIAIVDVIGHLIRDLVNSTDLGSDDQSVQKQVEVFFDILNERTRDLSSYVRAKDLAVLTKLCDLPAKFPKQRLDMSKLAVGMLEDKVATVRKNALTLLSQLVITHPYGLMHGGLMARKDWEEHYDKVSKELKKMEDIVGKAVENAEEATNAERSTAENGEDEEHGDGSDEGDEDGSQTPRKRPKAKSRKKDEDDMEVDEAPTEEERDTDDDVEMEDGDVTPKPKSKRDKPTKRRKSELNMEALTSEQAALAALDGNEMLSLKLRKKYYSEALNFIHQIENAIPIASQLLGSTHKSEVLEAMEFFRIIHEYKFEGAEEGIKKMLHLIWAKDNSSTSEDGKELKGIRSRLLECYKNLYLDPIADLGPQENVNRIAKNMIQLTYGTTLAELTSLEEMMRILMESRQIHVDVINKLWQVYTYSNPARELPKQQRRGAAIILGMLAVASPKVVEVRREDLIKIGLGARGKADMTLAKYTCIALGRLNGSAKKIKGSLVDQNKRFPMNDMIFRRLQQAIEHPSRSTDWFGMAEQAINTIYALAEKPDQLCDAIIRDLTKRAFRKKNAAVSKPPNASTNDPDGMDEGEDPTPRPEPESTQEDTQSSNICDDQGDAFELSKLLFVVGHVAIKHIAYLELVERELKRQKGVLEAEEKKARHASPTQSSKDGEELEQVVGNAEDDIGDRLAAIRESELLYGENSLLAVYGPMLAFICRNPGRFKNRTLRGAAVLSFSKFLCVSSQYCDQWHPILFNLLKTSKDPNIRSNIVIALGDVAVSFSSIFDDNSNELYKGLSDTSLIVKKNTLMVLTHLILNGMIKVKGQLGEMAKCLEDPDARISDLAKLFFTELSTKDNAIYNNLPDVISHLSSGDYAVDEDNFQSTMKYIFTFIEKEKQAENIVEKLCQRFHLTDDPRQWRDIAFCLSLLPFKSERSVKKLTEGLQFYRDKLHEPAVFAKFQEILGKARANKSANKPDVELNEFEALLEQHRTQGEDDIALEARVGKKKASAKKRASKQTRRKKKATPQPEPEPEPIRYREDDDGESLYASE